MLKAHIDTLIYPVNTCKGFNVYQLLFFLQVISLRLALDIHGRGRSDGTQPHIQRPSGQTLLCGKSGYFIVYLLYMVEPSLNRARIK